MYFAEGTDKQCSVDWSVRSENTSMCCPEGKLKKKHVMTFLFGFGRLVNRLLISSAYFVVISHIFFCKVFEYFQSAFLSRASGP